jgi:hypothetical protein
MNDLRKAAEMALKALEDIFGKEKKDVGAINALRQALAPEVTPEVNEPEGWVKIDEVRQYFDSVGCGTIYKTAGEGRVPLYTAPYTKLDTTAGVLHKEWVGLTDEEIQAERHKLDPTAGWTYDHLARAIEAKLKEKNT